MKKVISFFWLAVAAATLCCCSGSKEVTLVENGTPAGTIYYGSQPCDRSAAQLLSTFIGHISGAEMPLSQWTDQTTLKPGDVFIRTSEGTAELTEDGASISTVDGHLEIIGGPGKGALSGVVIVLEQYLGCNYWGAQEFTAPKQSTVALPHISLTENPGFRYRQVSGYMAEADSLYRLWYRLESPREEFAGNLWVHTFDRLLPSAEYGEKHPEYYAYFDGKRHPGKASQWCLTNPEVLEVVAARIDSIFKANPGLNMISVSQNDGNHTHCRCDSCAAVDQYEGALSGNVIRFVNKLAERFPDKQFSTLAYLYTCQPPKHVKPLPNVNIMLCDIDCRREVPLTDNDSGREFVKALEGWSAISDNIFVWDYGINFDGYLTPFPNFHILAPNIRLFKKHHATMHFSQINGSRGGDFCELRAYMVQKLMWNPCADPDSLRQHFLNGYYGKAAPHIGKYLDELTARLLESKQPLWIYDSPNSHKQGMLSAEACKLYNDLFDKAEQAVADNDEQLMRVRRSRLSLQYSQLEIMRTDAAADPAKTAALLDLFEQRVKEYDIPAINERNNSPLDYCTLYRERYLPHEGAENLARGCAVSYEIQPPKPYDKIAPVALTDGLFGGATYVDSWVGWEGIDASMTLDLGKEQTFSTVRADFLHQLGAWILLPKSVTYEISADGRAFTALGRHDLPEDRDTQVKFVWVEHKCPTPVSARYIRISVEGTKQCPHWHYGVGNPCWFFLDEIEVKK